MHVFEFDEKKSTSNLKKHGIDFVMAQELWQDPDLIEVKAKSENEPRSLAIARIADTHWSAVITHHRSTIRIISRSEEHTSELQSH